MQRADRRVSLVGGGVRDKGIALADVQLVRDHVSIRAKKVQQVVGEKLAERELANE